MNDRELLEYIAAQVGNLTSQVGVLASDMKEVKADIKDLKEDVSILKNQVAVIEVEHGKKLSALFDGYTQNTKLLKDIGEEVAKHEEVIIKRVK